MKRYFWPIVPTAVIILCAVNLFACEDPWNGSDKKWHFGAGFVIDSSVEWCAAPYYSRGITRLWGMGLSNLAFIGKEVWDATEPGNHFCLKDICADELGMLSGVAVMALLVHNEGVRLYWSAPPRVALSVKF